ncbi:FAD-dependent oxidoreductase [Crocosphaera sp.]|uniref:FAD-dependent oxidoreductase n=1 Tax=Crocosphaera sp. TaxID=2729996 RepID=UPI003F266E3E|nr:FAD-dependent oxidoreductase [Crocosphaera sp.]
MSLDYDLVIIGHSLEAIFAASQAIKYKARVALVVGNIKDNNWHEQDSLMLNYLMDIDRRWHDLTQWDLNINSVSHLTDHHIQSWRHEVKRNIGIAYDLEKLAHLGVDIIEESGEFCRLPKLGFVLSNRTLRSRRYLLAMGSISSIPNIQGLVEVGYIIPETLNIHKLPQNLVIFSQTSLGIELAQQLNYLGKNVTLIVENPNILPQEDQQIVQLIQTILEAEGINLIINCSITQVRKIEDKKWIQAGNEALETDEIIIVTHKQHKIKGLNLEGVKVALEAGKIKVNHKLQTTNPNIYACRNTIVSNIAQYEANIAVKNAIFYPMFKVDYTFHPLRILTNPIFSRVGLTETQAKQIYKDDLVIIKHNYNSLFKGKILNETTGFCKLITRRNGLILGCHIIGHNSDEIINIVALAMKNKIKIQQISELFPLYGTASEIILQISQNWQQQKHQDNKLFNNCLESLLFWRRKWNL